MNAKEMRELTAKGLVEQERARVAHMPVLFKKIDELISDMAKMGYTEAKVDRYLDGRYINYVKQIKERYEELGFIVEPIKHESWWCYISISWKEEN